MPKAPGFTINGIKENAFWFRTPKADLTEDEGLRFSVENNLNIHTATHIIEVLVTIEIHRDKEEPSPKRPPLLNYQVTFSFEVGEFDTSSHPDEEPGFEYIQLPKGLAATLISAAYSTCRGLLFVRTAGSQLHNYLLPIANPVELANNIKDKIRKKITETPNQSTEQEEVVI